MAAYTKGTQSPITTKRNKKSSQNRIISPITVPQGLQQNASLAIQPSETLNEFPSEQEISPVNKISSNKQKQASLNSAELRSSGLLQSAYQQVMGRSSGGVQSQNQGAGNMFGGGGFYESMPALEAASLRLADAALQRDMLSQEQRGLQETGLQRLRGEQEMGLQRMRGGQEMGLQQLRGTQETGLQGLRGRQERGLQTLRGKQESSIASQKERSERRSEVEREIRALERERTAIGAQPYSPSNRAYYDGLGNQINALRRQL